MNYIKARTKLKRMIKNTPPLTETMEILQACLRALADCIEMGLKGEE